MRPPFAILVLGGTGVFGSRICRRLARDPSLRVFVGGRSRAKAERLARQIRQATPSADVQPEAAAHWYTLARICEKLEDYERGFEASGAAVARSDDHYESWLLHGNLALQLGKVEDALAAYGSAIRLHPERIEARVNEAAALNRLERIEEALTRFDKILTAISPYLKSIAMP